MIYEFASPAWMAFMHGMVVERARQLHATAPEIGWSICEVFTDPPKSLSPNGAPIAWSAVVKDGRVEFGDKDIDEVEFKVIVDYQAILPIGRYDTMGLPERKAELAIMAENLRNTGTMRVVGDRSNRDPRIGDFHDIIARVTA